jgi:hypothetical protein
MWAGTVGSRHISVKTVEASLTRVYRKTSGASRVDLAVAVTQHRIQVGDEPMDGQTGHA